MNTLVRGTRRHFEPSLISGTLAVKSLRLLLGLYKVRNRYTSALCIVILPCTIKV
jgi:hypothetical protein